MLLDYNGGCGETDADIQLATRLLAQYGRHPNVIGSLVVSLGCETLDARDLTQRIACGTAPCELLVIQELGGTRRTMEKGVRLAEQMLARVKGREYTAQGLEREPCSLSALTIGLECGGSDATSGMAANPAMGVFSDLMAAQGARVILSETSELLGAEHVLSERAASADVAQRLLRAIDDCEVFLKATGEDFMGKQPSPGNVEGGITTVEEKALGDVLKGGTTPIVDVLEYGVPPAMPGLSFMDTPGNDLASVTGMVAAGSQIVVFTTGRGNPLGNAIAPVIKVTGNRYTYGRMGEDIDIDASTIISGAETVAQVGARIYDFLIRVASGERTAAEVLGHAEFMMLRRGPIY
jgi:altronate dehydratase large subunit